MNRKPKVSKENLQTAKRLLKYVTRNVQGSVCDRIYLYFIKFDRINFGIIVPQVFNR